MDTTIKLNQNAMYSVKCDILSNDIANHKNARATLLQAGGYERRGREVGGTVCIHFWGPSVLCLLMNNEISLHMPTKAINSSSHIYMNGKYMST
jgi:hypothetical protein